MENNFAKMHEWLTGFDNYNVTPPTYVEKPLSEEQISELRALIDWHKTLKGTSSKVVPEHEEIVDDDVRVPRKMYELSRQIIDFIMPKNIEKTIDSIIKPMYKDEIRLSHYNYLDYSLEHGDGRYLPTLQPHIDASNALLTFNYMLDGNIDWDVCVDDTCYGLRPGDAIIFSAVNQVHWRPKRKWKAGEFVEIVTLNYSPLDDWVFTNQIDPIHPFLRTEERKKHNSEFQSTFAYARAFEKYQMDGLRDGIPLDKYGLVVDENDNETDSIINQRSEGYAPDGYLFDLANTSENVKFSEEIKDPKNKKYMKQVG